jgi:protein ImuB
VSDRDRHLWICLYFNRLNSETQVPHELATRAMRFTPAVSIEGDNALLLDVHASLKFFGGLGRLRARLDEDFQACGHRFVTACAPTALAALWLARAGRERSVRDCAGLPARLGELPLAVLAWPADVQRRLSGMGVATVGECIRLPRDGLARRIGPERLAELDRAFGARPEARVFHRPPLHFEASLDLPAETADTGLLLVALQELLMRLQAFLRRHQAGVQALWISLHHPDRPATAERVGLLRAATDTVYLLELARIRFADLRLAAPVASIMLQATPAAASAVAGRDLLGVRARPRDADLALVEQLRVRLGTEAVHGIRSVAEHRPEVAWRPVSFAGRTAPRQEPVGTAEFCYQPVSRRPVWMLREPRALQSTAGQPVCGGVLHLEGAPERIETGWWDGGDIRRDYYVARDPRGTRLWVFRDHGREHGREPRWYLHGLFG